MEQINKFDVDFTIEIIDEHTLQVLEKKYPGKLHFDGGRIFTLHVTAPIKGLADKDPDMWKTMLKDKPEIVRAYVMGRLKGEI
jgi:hypothetical protein